MPEFFRKHPRGDRIPASAKEPTLLYRARSYFPVQLDFDFV